jgi:hypothetical protein
MREYRTIAEGGVGFSIGRGPFSTNPAFSLTGEDTFALTIADLKQVVIAENRGAGGLPPYPFRSGV